LASIEEFNDPGTVRHLEALGVGAGWRCLEIGAGGGSVAEWLCRRVGPSGHVVATELDTKFLDVLRYPNIEVLRHDISRDGLPDDSFDLIHERAVLIHHPGRDKILGRLARALRPGGWLLCEGSDFSTVVHGSPFPVLGKVAGAMVAFLESTGADPNYGRRLSFALDAHDLVETGAEGRVYMMRGGDRTAVLPRSPSNVCVESSRLCQVLTT
jgi:SAM-dependent methyltransferase